MNPLDALYRAQRAWEASQPQMFMELWPDTGLGEGETAHSAAEHAAGLPIAEPVANPLLAVGGGLDPGAEPRHGTFSELTAMPERDPALGSAVALAPDGAGSAPLFTAIGPGRMSSEDTGDRGQEVPV